MLAADEAIAAAERVFSRLERTAAFLLADKILLYHSLPDELSTRSFLEKWQSRKHFYLPRVNGVNLDILPYDNSRLHIGAFNIEEPTGDDLTDINEIEPYSDTGSSIRPQRQPRGPRQRILRPSARRDPCRENRCRI